MGTFVYMRGFNHRKTVQALNFLAIKSGGELNKMKAIKLLWLADRLHLREHGRTITGDSYFAMDNGPVSSNTRDILNQNSDFLGENELEYSKNFIVEKDKYTYSTLINIEEKVFSKSDLEVLEKVFSKYGNLGKYQLRDLSHEFPEWKKHEEVIKKKISSRVEMNQIDFFENASAKIDFFPVDTDSLEVSKERYLESCAIAKILK